MFASTADELLLAFRQDVDDYAAYTTANDTACLWKDVEIYRYLTVACDALARDTLGLNKLVRLPYVANSPNVALPRYVLHINAARDLTQKRPLEMVNTAFSGLTNGDDYGRRLVASDAMFEGVGQPAYYVRDYDAKALRLVPIPQAAGEIELQCTVTIGSPMAAGAALPFLDSVDLQLLLENMKAQAYRKQDAETEDLTRATRASNLYTAGVKDRKSDVLNYRRSPGTVRMEY